MTDYKGLPTRLARVLETITLFKDEPQALKKMITMHLEATWLEGKIDAMKDKEER
jgi:hypothetical protein